MVANDVAKMAERAKFDDPVLNGVTPTLPELIAFTQDEHRAIWAGKSRARAQWNRVAATHGFYDPKLETGLLQTGGPLRAPDSFLPGYVEADSIAARAGVLLPLDPGVNLRASLTHWQPFDHAKRDGHATVAGLSAQIPLLKDRGFETIRLNTQAAEALAYAAEAGSDTIIQNVRHNISTAYIAHLRALAAYQESLSASNRAARIYAETQERVKLTANAAYELHTARMEIALRTDDVQAADNAKKQSFLSLQNAMGFFPFLDPERGMELPRIFPKHFTYDDELHRWAAFCRINSTNVFNAHVSDIHHHRRPEMGAAISMQHFHDRQIDLAKTAMKSDLSLRAGIGWRLNDSQWGYNSGDTFGWEVGIVWTRPFGFTAEQKNLEAAADEHWAAYAEQSVLTNTIRTETRRARAALESALQRFELVQLAVDEAQKALAAEEERFRIGEGRTRNVLDAQKDLTNANLRSHDVAAELLRAYFDLAHATGQLAP